MTVFIASDMEIIKALNVLSIKSNTIMSGWVEQQHKLSCWAAILIPFFVVVVVVANAVFISFLVRS